MPAYNEAGSLPHLLADFATLAEKEVSYDWEFLVINDGSKDNSRAVLTELRTKDSRLHFINLSRNFGKESAILAGFDFAKGDCVVLMDADMQHPVDAVSEMLRQWEEGYDDVYGKRITRGKESLIRKKLSLAYYRLLQKSTNIDILTNVGDFRLLDRRCVDMMRSMRETQRNTKSLLCWIGYNKTGVDFHTNDRSDGKSKYRFGALVNLALDGITSFTTAPLRLATLLGLVTSFAAFLYIAVILCKTLIWGESVQGFPTLMCVILFLGGCQLLAIGIIGEYIGRIFNESKNRPPYIVESYDNNRITSRTDPYT